MISNSVNGPEHIAGELTEFERTKMENFALKHNALTQQSQQNLAERNAFIEKINAAHPGWTWRDPDGLIKDYKPEPVAGKGAKTR